MEVKDIETDIIKDIENNIINNTPREEINECYKYKEVLERCYNNSPALMIKAIEKYNTKNITDIYPPLYTPLNMDMDMDMNMFMDIDIKNMNIHDYFIKLLDKAYEQIYG
jgi:hypothetical protein